MRLTRSTRSHSASSTRWTGPPPATPAAFTHDVEAARASAADGPDGGFDRGLVADVDGVERGPGGRRRRARLEVEAHDGGALVGEAAGRRRAPMPDAAPVTSATLPSSRPTASS